MELATRRRTYRLVRAGLIVLTIGVVAIWFLRRAPREEIQIQAEAPSVESLGPGDIQIYNSDSTVDLVLQGDRILAGLSPQTIAKIRAELETSIAKDTSGVGGTIAQMVKRTVAGAIGTRVVYNLAEIRDVRYDDGELVLERERGGEAELFKNTKVDGKPLSKSFRPEDAQRFIAAVRQRKNSMAHRPD